MSCQYQGYEFGAGYLDSLCIDGFLWDADSGDFEDGFMFGGDCACPRCNTKLYLEQARKAASEGGCGCSMGRPWCAAVQWEGALRVAFLQNQAETQQFLAKCVPFLTDDWPDRHAVYGRGVPWDGTVERKWPWSVEGLPQ